MLILSTKQTNDNERRKIMKLYTACRETGDFIEEVKSIQEGKELIKGYEEIDKNEGDYEGGFYTIVNENHEEVGE